MKILIVDDSRAMQAIVRRSVLNAGLEQLETQTAASGVEALKAIQETVPDLVLTDWHMPGMSGLELLQTIRQLGHTELQVGFLTAETHTLRLEEARRNGACFVITKPFSDEELLTHLRVVADGLLERESRPTPLKIEDVSALIRDIVREVPFRLVDREMNVSHLTHRNLLALYRSGGNGPVVALSVMDIQCVSMIGAASSAMVPNAAKPIVQSGQPTPDMVTAAGRLLDGVAKRISGSWAAPLEMQRPSMVNRDFGKLLDLFQRNHGCASFRLDIPGYGSGRLAFFVV